MRQHPETSPDRSRRDPSRLRAARVLAALLLAACAGTGGRDEPAEPSAPPKSWPGVMRRVDREFEVVLGAIDRDPPGDLRAAAAAARRAAALVRTGYGEHLHADIPGFADLARACENWLLQIGQAAGEGNGERARRLLIETDHCARCHDAAEAHR